MMQDKEHSPRTNIVTVAVIVGIALVLYYQYSIVSSNKIVDIASQEVRSNVKIEVHDLTQILTITNC